MKKRLKITKVEPRTLWVGGEVICDEPASGWNSLYRSLLRLDETAAQKKEEKMKKLMWYLRQFLPLTYYSSYSVGGKREVTVFRMWFGKCFDIRNY